MKNKNNAPEKKEMNNPVNGEEIKKNSKKTKKLIIFGGLGGILILVLVCVFLFKTPTRVNFVTNSPNTTIQSVIIDETTGKINFPENPVRYGYYFVGWYSNKELTHLWNQETDLFVEKDTITGEYKKSDDKYVIVNTTLYGRWELDQVTINYHLDGGVNSGNNPTTYTIKHEPTEAEIIEYGSRDKAMAVTFLPNLSLENPTKDGYRFEGWYSDPEFTTRVNNINRVELPEIDNTNKKIGINDIEYYGHKSLDLYAHWIKSLN